MSEIKEGDVVVLKSGGKLMTLGDTPFNKGQHRTCYWFDGAELKTAEIHISALKLASE
ncbi:DUF2158 domain-containing protein [Marinibacterium profundimaris]|uniref:DUF2158 domain-containing protein n=1 Tax=Marinibacterium profundimaris TaxID=1679460 RepID=UPI000B51E671|nr:DUF2158 domain-containing protein [Marinibacterium profundimaris]